MITFKNYLLIETLLKSGIEFFLNPTKVELNKAKAWVRGLAFSDGSFVIAKNTTSASFHLELEGATDRAAQESKNELIFKGINLSNIVQVQRIEDSNTFAFGEQTRVGKISIRDKNILKNVRKKSPHIRFSLNNILAFDLPARISGFDKQGIDFVKRDIKDVSNEKI